jgi:hypothetical protein
MTMSWRLGVLAVMGWLAVASAAALEARGYIKGKDLESRVYDGTGHFETWWQARSGEALTFLLASTQ